MLLAEMLPASRRTRGSAARAGRHRAAGVLRHHPDDRHRHRPVVLHGIRRRPASNCWPRTRTANSARLHEAADRMQRGLDELIAGVPDGSPPERRIGLARCAGGLSAGRRRSGLAAPRREVISGGLTAEAAVSRVATELHDRMRRISDPYLRERLADLEDLANRLLTTLTGDLPREAVPPGRDPARPPAGTGRVAGLARHGHRRHRDRGGQPVRPRRDPGARAGDSRRRRHARHARHRRTGRRGGDRRRRRATGAAARGRGPRRSISARWRRTRCATPAGRRCATGRRSRRTACGSA